MNVNEIVTRAFVATEIFGIDPGKSNGGFAKWNGERYEVWSIKKITSFDALVDFWKYQAEICKLPLVFIEQITTYPADFGNEGMTNEKRSMMIGRMYQMNKLKDHYVELRSALKLANIQFIEVMPSSWQKYLEIHKSGEDYKIRKERYKDIAASWFPSIQVTAWNSDALLLIEFGRKKLKYDNRWILNKLKKKTDTKLLFK